MRSPEKPWEKKTNSRDKRESSRDERPFAKRTSTRKPWEEQRDPLPRPKRTNSRKPWEDMKPAERQRPAKKSFTSELFGNDVRRGEKPVRTKSADNKKPNPNRKTERLQRAIHYAKQRTLGKEEVEDAYTEKMQDKLLKRSSKKKEEIAGKVKTAAPTPARKDNTVRLNKYLANAGVAARRKCDEIIAAGLVKVNGVVVIEMGHRLKPDDKVTYKGKIIKPVNYVYILLNKPKDYITTVDDERDRHTVMELIANATTERVYPVGRLDRNTTGLLLFTNDGELAQKLMHPKYGAQKIYEVELDKQLAPKDMQAIADGVELEDGMAYVDGIDYAHAVKKNVVGVSIHIGKNRIVRRIFEHFGYEVVRLDRTLYAGLTKRDLPRGRWRHLTEREVIKLKYLK